MLSFLFLSLIPLGYFRKLIKNIAFLQRGLLLLQAFYVIKYSWRKKIEFNICKVSNLERICFLKKSNPRHKNSQISGIHNSPIFWRFTIPGDILCCICICASNQMHLLEQTLFIQPIYF